MKITEYDIKILVCRCKIENASKSTTAILSLDELIQIEEIDGTLYEFITLKLKNVNTSDNF